ncbi:putative adipose-regulatory protein-domain-containing protein, partial [Dipodascopsis tothii]|uniref:putative adipose-regulatory protein-domain-containing protein n=1 Tax=Dipodascopsis tothii TaxID=44089 RepID=UPI0034CF0B9D
RTLFWPVTFFGSKAMLKTYLQIFLAALTSCSLFAIAVVAYLVFYHSWIPYESVKIPLFFNHLSQTAPCVLFQVPSGRMLSHSQDYAVTVHLSIPANPHNQQLGNFMLNMKYYDDDPFQLLSASSRTPADAANDVAVHNLRVLLSNGDRVARALEPITSFNTLKPAILSYKSPLLESLRTIVFLPGFLTGFMNQEEHIDVVMYDDWSYRKGLPSRYAFISINQPLQIYSASVEWSVQWSGVRYLMHHYYITSFIVAVSSFWTIEMIFTFTAWILVTAMF